MGVKSLNANKTDMLSMQCAEFYFKLSVMLLCMINKRLKKLYFSTMWSVLCVVLVCGGGHCQMDPQGVGRLSKLPVM